MKKLVCLLLVVAIACAGAFALAGCGNDDVVVSYEYEYARFSNSTNAEGGYIGSIEKVEFRGNYTIVTIYYKSGNGTKMMTTGVDGVRLYSESDS